MESTAPQSVIETQSFLASAKRVLSDGERLSLIDAVARNPLAGDLMEGTGGANEGKSGGYRVVYYFHSAGVPVFMLDIFAKNEKANLSKAERNELAMILSELARTYLEGVKAHVGSR